MKKGEWASAGGGGVECRGREEGRQRVRERETERGSEMPPSFKLVLLSLEHSMNYSVQRVLPQTDK